MSDEREKQYRNRNRIGTGRTCEFSNRGDNN